MKSQPIRKYALVAMAALLAVAVVIGGCHGVTW